VGKWNGIGHSPGADIDGSVLGLFVDGDANLTSEIVSYEMGIEHLKVSHGVARLAVCKRKTSVDYMKQHWTSHLVSGRAPPRSSNIPLRLFPFQMQDSPRDRCVRSWELSDVVAGTDKASPSRAA